MIAEQENHTELTDPMPSALFPSKTFSYYVYCGPTAVIIDTVSTTIQSKLNLPSKKMLANRLHGRAKQLYN